MAKYPYTVEDNLRAVNELRALSGDQPLSMERYLQNHENMKKGIYPWSDPAPKDFFQRLHNACKQGKAAFVKAMQKP
ncbi:hypothetical protein FD01_GL001073 [Lacticaseibacillus manihotivorans DSM 13343 = JCM 12514]|uniref:Uncharacterized protein n=2 Tax=Lacticaseibacillus manihotivorans TaxID=88233 RepID=A0A0R1QR11_9LACO|nr:hypothetical protein FD01_GL001073 [Lacticaseibacillus manihotivorans DSM 13343 = JCM 12514]